MFAACVKHAARLIGCAKNRWGINLAAGRKRKRKKHGGKTPERWWRWLVIVALLGIIVASVGVVFLDLLIRAKFTGSKWVLPAHVYSRSLELYPGQALRQDRFVWELQQLGYRPSSAINSAGEYRVSGNQVQLYLRPFRFWDGDEPARYVAATFNSGTLSRLNDRRGQPLGLVRLEPLMIGGIYPEQVEDRIPVRMEQLPPYLADALIAVEDREFYRHHGISLKGISRAMLSNLRSGKMTQGGSTITQQLVKNFYLNNERTLSRKALEAVMAILLEWHYSKTEILETYINEVYLGQAGKRAIHGFGLASQHYFRQPLRELDIHQVALLVGMVKGASYYDPWRNGERALQRRNLVINVMAERQLIDAQQAARAERAPLGISTHPGTDSNPFPAYLDLVKRQLREDYQDRDLRSEGLRIFTNFDPQVQRQLEQSATAQLGAVERDYRLAQETLETAAVVVRVGTGDVLALAGGRQPGFAGFNRALDASRSVGSTLKPAVYLAALEQPRRYTLGTLISDAPVSFPVAGKEPWEPRNYDRTSHGEVPLYRALAQSYNQATARLGMELGVPAVVDVVRRLGYQQALPAVPALTLGGVTMTPLNVAEIYHTIAADGFYTPLRAINSVYTVDNQPLKRYPYNVEQRFSPQVMHLLHYALQAVVREGTGKGVYRWLPQHMVVAGKTGTSNGQRDSWFSGFSGNYLSVVWVGRDDNEKMPVTGGTGALKVWAELMARLDNQPFPFTRPEGVVYHWMDPDSGSLAEEGCAGAHYLPFVAGSEPQLHSPCYRRQAPDVVDWLKGILNW